MRSSRFHLGLAPPRPNYPLPEPRQCASTHAYDCRLNFGGPKRDRKLTRNRYTFG